MEPNTDRCTETHKYDNHHSNSRQRHAFGLSVTTFQLASAYVRFPHLFIAGMPKQTYADDNTAFQCQSFLNFKKLFLETGASAKCDDFVVLYHFNTFGH